MSLGSDEPDLPGILRLDDADVDLAIAHAQDNRFEALGDLLVGIKERLQKIFALLLAADAGQIRADLASFAFDLVAADAGNFSLVEEDILACVSITAGQGLAIASKQSAPGAGCFISSELALHLGRFTPAGGVQEVKLDFQRNLIGT